MKANIKKVLFAILVTLILLGSVSLTFASEYLGEYCFTNESGLPYFRLAVTDMGDYHYTFNGRVQTEHGWAPVGGSSEVLYGSLYMVVLSAGGNSTTFFDSNTWRAVLNLDNWSGYVETMTTTTYSDGSHAVTHKMENLFYTQCY